MIYTSRNISGYRSLLLL
jgi:hypothetical protein